ncbi:MAG TPA: hypothetical protein VNU23_08940 [Candidatus Cybelea sp.]|nr:hypothetical protein [Candidatus Cybelea sp.]
MDNELDVSQGALEMLILKAASLGPLHAYHWNRMTQVIPRILRTTSEEA